MNGKTVTLKDIAEKLNVSTVTISKALRGHPDISAKTKKIIQAAADEMGYSPNFMARNLSSKRSNTIGVVVPKIAHFFFGDIIESMYEVAFKNNYELILMISSENAEREKEHIQTLLSMRVDGLIISISQETKDYEIFENIHQRGVPTVFMDRTPDLPNINRVMVDDRGGAFKAIEHAIQLGYRNIAHFAGYTEINIGQKRYQGFVDAMNKYNVPIKPDWVVHGGFGEQYGYEAFMKLYKENNLPDLIFTVTYPVALGVYSAASETKLRIPEDIDVICFGNAKVQNFLSPPLSCVNQPTNQLAEKTIEMLINNINNQEDFEIKDVQIDTDLILRGTCTKFNKLKSDK